LFTLLQHLATAGVLKMVSEAVKIRSIGRLDKPLWIGIMLVYGTSGSFYGQLFVAHIQRDFS